MLPNLGGTFFQVNGLNAAGQLTGYSFLPGDAEAHAYRTGANGVGITDLLTLGGTSSQGFAINNLGHVAGDSVTDIAENHAFLYTSGPMLDLGTLGGPFSSAVDVNNSDQVIGNSLTAGFASEGFIYSGGPIQSLGTLGGTFSTAADINDGGLAVGNSTTDLDEETHAFVYTNSAMVDLETLGGFYSAAFAINNSNIIVGESMNIDGDVHAFAKSTGIMIDLGTLGGAFSSATKINEVGQIIGTSTTTSDAESHGFIYSGGTMTDLGTLGGDYSSPSALNNLGQIVGESGTSNGVAHAFVWQNGVMTDLNSLLPTNSGWELSTAYLINDAGRIIGVGITNGQSTWFSLLLSSGSANNSPVAVAGNDQNASCDAAVTLDGSASSDPDNDALTYQWSLGGNVFSSNPTAVVSLAVGTYTFTLTVSDPCGASSQDDVVVTVSDAVPPTGSVPTSITLPVGANCQAAVPNVLSNVVASDNCTSSDALVISQNPTAGTLLSKGQHTIAVTVTDASSNNSVANITLNIVDTTAPVITSSPASVTAPIGANCQGTVPDVTSQIVASDNCSGALAITQSPVAGTTLPAGHYTIVVTVTDDSGNSTTANVALTIADGAAPVISSVTASPNVISPPNGSIIPVTVTVVASDNCGTPVNQIISITANEPVPAGDIQITGALTANLRASKNPTGDQRIYTITVGSKDASGNCSTSTVTVTVLKNQSGK